MFSWMCSRLRLKQYRLQMLTSILPCTLYATAKENETEKYIS
ncbi:hypothetical protein HMPREF9248_0865 [Fannyhessea vaginae PB189-T1-4]|uniref:Uncharacterized protein n=1 Tax=Fannyhessea vaginae PB189-T1-4 TaxID=866774 RepID=A0ABP2J1K3_9ACTN|nr:hypothetical protein HMPREF9248_0865 [Fannyhessea vaginae PB189-T1-4]